MQKNSHEKQKYTLHCAVWEFTLGCNFRCIHCGASAGIPRNDELNPAEALKFVDDLADIGCRGVGLIGGEPFVRPDWFDVSKRINERGMILSYVSNGWLMSDELAEKISSLAPRSFGLSIDGTEMIHDQIRKKGSYQRCIRAMKILEKHCIHTSIITTVHRMNLSCLPSVFNLLSGKNVCWQIQIATPHGTRFSKDNFLSADEHYQVVKFVYEARKKAENSPLR
jgi:MoaA/NifB/PqqE/SkfB family radical SAM enzyme